MAQTSKLQGGLERGAALLPRLNSMEYPQKVMCPPKQHIPHMEVTEWVEGWVFLRLLPNPQVCMVSLASWRGFSCCSLWSGVRSSIAFEG